MSLLQYKVFLMLFYHSQSSYFFVHSRLLWRCWGFPECFVPTFLVFILLYCFHPFPSCCLLESSGFSISLKQLWSVTHIFTSSLMGYFLLAEEKLLLFILGARRKGMLFSVAVPEGAGFCLKWKVISGADLHLNTKGFFPKACLFTSHALILNV